MIMSSVQPSPNRGCAPHAALALAWIVVLAPVTGCGVAEQNIGLAVGIGTVLTGQSPGQEIEQVYYLGVFDPQDQVPPTIYRLTVRGQASMISGMKFGSGWVHHSVIDALNTHVGFADTSNRPEITGAGANEPGAGLPAMQTGRRLMMFGPEGFREAPRDHRLVIVMGSSPEKFFNAIDTSLGMIAQVRRDHIDPAVTRQIVAERERLRGEQRQLGELAREVAAEMPEAK
jgi:hypothetical protein